MNSDSFACGPNRFFSMIILMFFFAISIMSQQNTLQINEKYKFLHQGLTVVDLGCAPGGWLQIASQEVGSTGGKETVVGVDLLRTDDIAGCISILGDISEKSIGDKLINILGCKPNIVLSDMAANTTGHRKTDHIRTTYLVETALDFAIGNLEKNGVFLAKCFKGGAEIESLSLMRKYFTKVKKNAKLLRLIFC